MRKLLLLTCLTCFFYIRSIGQESATAIQITKAELISLKDIKPLLTIDPNKNYIVRHFTLSGSTVENSDKGTVSISFSESADGGIFSEKQRSLIEKYSKKGMVFSIGDISVMETGKPGTTYNPAAEIYFTAPNVSVIIKE
jgi:hypothetical protein